MGPPQAPIPVDPASVGRVVPPAGTEVPPVPGIFQPSYQLTEAEFMNVQAPSIFWVSLGSVLSTFAIGSALDKLDDLMKHVITIKGLLFPQGLILLLGLACIGLSGILSRKRRNAVKTIERFFRDNPGQPEVRVGRR